MSREEVNELVADLISKETSAFTDYVMSLDGDRKLTPDVFYSVLLECSAHITVAILESFGLISVKE